jgi:uncharacterized protein (TIGR02594 family)
MGASVIKTPYELGTRFMGIKERPGALANNPQILAMLQLDGDSWVTNDETAWCSAYVKYVCHLYGDIPRSKRLNARSWLAVGTPVEVEDAMRGFDIVILKRGVDPQPGPDVLDAPGHVGFFSELAPGKVWLLGGNQGNTVSVAPFDVTRILGVRRLAA